MYAITPQDVLINLNDKADRKHCLVVLTDEQWRQIVKAYKSPLLDEISTDVLVFHPLYPIDSNGTHYDNPQWIMDEIDDV